jgi:DNA-binding IclR family transcriptional regulator
MGLAYMAGMRDDIRDRLQAELVAAEPAAADRIGAAVRGAIASQAAQGFVGTYGTWYSYINAVGVAFRPTDGSPLVAITCGGIVDMVPREACVATVGPDLVRTVERLRVRLAGMPDPLPTPAGTPAP